MCCRRLHSTRLTSDYAIMSEKPDWKIEPLVQWLMHEGRLLDGDALTAELGRRLVAAGAPADRLLVSLQLLHPLLVANSAIWSRGEDQVTSATYPISGLQSDAFQGSPIQYLYTERKPLRQRLDGDEPPSHGIYTDLRAQGYTDYFGVPLRFRGVGSSLMVVNCKAPGGFSDGDLDRFTELSHYLAPVVEVIAREHLARTLLDTYVGPRTGEKVLHGMIRRGDAETVDAALWFSDLRDFTHLTETLPPAQILAMLNNYFEFVAAAVTARGGEILRFIGDAMLIVFPVSTAGSAQAACRAALESARDAQANLATLNHRRRRAGEPEIQFGVGLNLGEVVYGNVGAPDRLDFTVMGPAVNRAARLESLTKSVGEPVLLSRAFVDCLGEPARHCGEHAMKGIDGLQEVLAPESE